MDRPFVFDRTAEPPAARRLLLLLLCLPSLQQRRSEWVVDPAAEGARSEAWLQAASGRGRWRGAQAAQERAILLAAIRAQVASYTIDPALLHHAARAPAAAPGVGRKRPASALGGSAQGRVVGREVRPAVALHAARLVESELEIWTAAQAGGRELPPREEEAALAASRARRRRLALDATTS